MSRSVSACLDSNLLISSDLDTKVDDCQVIDVLSDIRADFVHGDDQSYVLQKELAQNGTLGSEATSRVKGWKTDKSKFLPPVSRAWRMCSEKRWYDFYEDDTYTVWDDMFRLLADFDLEMPWYFGFPSPGARGFWMANGGPGYVLSREAPFDDLSKTTSTAMEPLMVLR